MAQILVTFAHPHIRAVGAPVIGITSTGLARNTSLDTAQAEAFIHCLKHGTAIHLARSVEVVTSHRIPFIWLDSVLSVNRILFI